LLHLARDAGYTGRLCGLDPAPGYCPWPAVSLSGQFVFETATRSPASGNAGPPANAVEVPDSSGALIRMEHHAEPPRGDLVTYTAPRLAGPQTSRSALRFLDPITLAGHLTAAGLAIHSQYGNWDASPLTPTSPESSLFASHLNEDDQAPR
jgi:hypothetical protein